MRRGAFIEDALGSVPSVGSARTSMLGAECLMLARWMLARFGDRFGGRLRQRGIERAAAIERTPTRRA